MRSVFSLFLHPFLLPALRGFNAGPLPAEESIAHENAPINDVIRHLPGFIFLFIYYLSFGAAEEQRQRAGAGMRADDRTDVSDDLHFLAVFVLQDILQHLCVFRAVSIGNEDRGIRPDRLAQFFCQLLDGLFPSVDKE